MTKLPGQARQHQGQALTEYMIATVFLTILVWYAFVGGSPDDTGRGGLWETEQVDATGNLLDDRFDKNEIALPGVIQAVHAKQENFAASIYEP